MLRILFLSADPDNANRLNVADEMDDIRRSLYSRLREDQIRIEISIAASLTHLQAEFLRVKPHIVHFSGHGTKSGKLIFKNASGAAEAGSIQDIGSLFELHKKSIHCVVLNACYSEEQASAIVKHIDCTIGTTTAISDQTARTFAGIFYLALASGSTVQNAFRGGLLQLRLEKGFADDMIKLQYRQEIDPSAFYVIENPETRLNESEIQAIFQQKPKSEASRNTEFLKIDYIGKPIREREYHVLLSCKDANREVIDNLYYWLHDVASIPTWYDYIKLPGGSSIDKELEKALSNCRSIILVISKASIANGWVRKEYEAATEHQIRFTDFRIIPIRIEECELPDFIGSVNSIDLYNHGLTLDNINQLLFSLYYNDVGFEFGKPEVYVSRTWREDKPSEVELADHVCKLLINAGFRLIGDSKDQKGFYGKNSQDRIRSIISSCVGFAAILPDRERGKTSKHMLREIEIAMEDQIPSLIVAEPNVQLQDDIDRLAIRLDMQLAKEDKTGKLQTGIVRLRDDSSNKPVHPHYIFFATDFKSEHEKRNSLIKEHLQRITSMECIIANNVVEVPMQENIAAKISHAFMMMADISDGADDTLIEAGIATGAGLKENLHLVARGPPHKIPFMFSGKQILYYKEDLELMGLAHSIGYGYRRRVLNYEFSK
jgi:TIR domain-containing protein/CHAT domain-containing protein